MDWQATWDDPFTAYLGTFEELLGDARTRTTFVETLSGIIAAGSLCGGYRAHPLGEQQGQLSRH